MKALILTQHPIYSKRTDIIMEKLIEAGYNVEQKVFTENDFVHGISFDFVAVDEEIKDREDFKKYCQNPLDSL